jgi:hypothetical protein
MNLVRFWIDKDKKMSSSGIDEPDQQVPDAETRTLQRRYPGLRFSYTFGDRQQKMNAREAHVTDTQNMDISIRAWVPPSQTGDIKDLVKTYKTLMRDPEVIRMQETQQQYSFVSALVIIGVVFAAIYFFG